MNWDASTFGAVKDRIAVKSTGDVPGYEELRGGGLKPVAVTPLRFVDGRWVLMLDDVEITDKSPVDIVTLDGQLHAHAAHLHCGAFMVALKD